MASRDSRVNPELRPSDPTTFKEQVEMLFGSAPPVLRRAVRKFLENEPGDLDHHCLRIIAAAAQAIDDPAIVAGMIDGLPITGMHLAAVRADLEPARAAFRTTLARYKPRTRERLVADLVRQTAVDILSFSPPERLNDAARALVGSHLLDRVRHDPRLEAVTLLSPFCTNDVVRTVLDRVERQVVNAARPRDGAEPRRVRLGDFSDRLKQVFHSQGSTADDVRRAWELARRCEYRSDFRDSENDIDGMIESITSSPHLDGPLVASVLDTLRELDAAGYWSGRRPGPDEYRSMLVASPHMPESMARRAIQDGIGAYVPLDAIDARLWVLRTHHYSDTSKSDLPHDLTSDEIDKMLVDIPRQLVSPKVIDEICRPETLRALASDESLDSASLAALVRNPNTPTDVSFGEIGRGLEDHVRSGSSGHWTTKRVIEREAILLSDSRLTDDDLARAFDVGRHSREHNELLEEAACNPSAGPKLLGVLDQLSAEDPIVLLARTSASPAVHRLLAQILEREAQRSGRRPTLNSLGHKLSSAILENGTVANEVLIEVVSSGQMMHPLASFRPLPRAASRPAPLDIARLVIDGRATRERIVSLMAWAENDTAESDTHTAIGLLADNDVLTAEHWARLLDSPDTHVKMLYATHPLCPPDARPVGLTASKMLTDTMLALEGGTSLPDDAGLKSWSQMPDTADLSFESRIAAARSFDRQVVDGRELQVPKTSKDLSDMATYMGNCLAGYEDRVREGRCVVAVTRGDNPIAVAWEVKRDDALSAGWGATQREMHLELKVIEVNTRFNRGGVPDTFRRGIDEMTERANRGELEPVPAPAVEAPATTADSVEAEDQPDPVRVREKIEMRRQQRTRRRALRLNVQSAGASDANEMTAPSMLGSRDGRTAQDSDNLDETDDKTTTFERPAPDTESPAHQIDSL